jgi:hypothetical protein
LTPRLRRINPIPCNNRRLCGNKEAVDEWKVYFMSDSLKELFDLLGADAALRGKIESARSIEEAYSQALAIRGGYTLQEFRAALTEMSGGEFSEDELEAVTGGLSFTVTPPPSPNRPQSGPFIPDDPTRPRPNQQFGVSIKITR